MDNFNYEIFHAPFTAYHTDLPKHYATITPFNDDGLDMTPIPPDPVSITIQHKTIIVDAACKGDSLSDTENDPATTQSEIDVCKQVDFSEVAKQAQAIQAKTLTKMQ